jgi:GTP-binding protein
MTSGTGIIHHVFDHFDVMGSSTVSKRKNGVLISNAMGKATAFALWNLQERGKIFIDPQTEVYEGMVVGIHSRNNDLVVNVIKGKQLTNIRTTSADEHIILVPPIKMTLEQALDFINDDELVEITPQHIRVRKKILTESDRRRAAREKK